MHPVIKLSTSLYPPCIISILYIKRNVNWILHEVCISQFCFQSLKASKKCFSIRFKLPGLEIRRNVMVGSCWDELVISTCFLCSTKVLAIERGWYIFVLMKQNYLNISMTPIQPITAQMKWEMNMHKYFQWWIIKCFPLHGAEYNFITSMGSSNMTELTKL